MFKLVEEMETASRRVDSDDRRTRLEGGCAG